MFLLVKQKEGVLSNKINKERERELPKEMRGGE